MPVEEKGTFDSNIFAVSQNFTEEEYIEALNRHTIPAASKLYGTSKKIKIDFPHDILEKDLNMFRIREHEWTHFRQHISTHLGILSYRLTALRENCAQMYFQALKEQNKSYNYLPFNYALLSGDFEKDSKEAALLNVWHMADNIEGALWGKTMPLKYLSYAWDALFSSFSNPQLMIYSKGCKLKTRRTLEDESCPHGYIRVQDVIEGFAKYKEIINIAQQFDITNVVEILADTLYSDYGVSWNYLKQYVDIPIFHPLNGAMQEVALLSFLDPFFCKDFDELFWEDIHPGFRFMEASQELQKGLKKIPWNFDDCYYEAQKAFGWFGKYKNQQDQYYSCLKEAIKKDYMPIRNLKRTLNSDDDKLMLQFHKSTFIKALNIRSKAPSIYFDTQSYLGKPIFDDFLSITRPHIVIDPVKLFIPHGAHRSLEIALLSCRYALGQIAFDEIARKGRLDFLFTFIKKGISEKLPVLPNINKIKESLKEAFYGILDDHIEEKFKTLL